MTEINYYLPSEFVFFTLMSPKLFVYIFQTNNSMFIFSLLFYVSDLI
jgi:hypothetical protein